MLLLISSLEAVLKVTPLPFGALEAASLASKFSLLTLGASGFLFLGGGAWFLGSFIFCWFRFLPWFPGWRVAAAVGGAAAPLAGVAIGPLLGVAIPAGHLAAAISIVAAMLRPVLMVAGLHLLARSAPGETSVSISLTLSFCKYKKGQN